MHNRHYILRKVYIVLTFTSVLGAGIPSLKLHGKLRQKKRSRRPLKQCLMHQSLSIQRQLKQMMDLSLLRWTQRWEKNYQSKTQKRLILSNNFRFCLNRPASRILILNLIDLIVLSCRLTTKNPAKIARKLKARRLAAARGINPAKKKKSNPLGGANQFHKKNKKR